MNQYIIQVFSGLRTDDTNDLKCLSLNDAKQAVHVAARISKLFSCQVGIIYSDMALFMFQDGKLVAEPPKDEEGKYWFPNEPIVDLYHPSYKWLQELEMAIYWFMMAERIKQENSKS